MTIENMKSRKSKNILLFSIFLLLVSFLFYLAYDKNNLNKMLSKFGLKNQENSQNSSSGLISYKNMLTGLSFKYPASLTERDMGQGVEYYNFVRFEEPLDGSVKGIGFGVQKDTGYSEEAERIKKDFDKQGEGILSEQKKITIAGNPGILLTYKPKRESADLEVRSIAVFSKGEYTYSISTVPDQIDKILKSVSF